MISTPMLNALRKPVQTLQETCSSLFGGGPKQTSDAAADLRAADLGEASRYDSTQWAPTGWAETSMEPRLP